MAVLISSFPIGGLKRRKLPLPGTGQCRVAQVTLPSALFESARYFPPVRGGGLEQFRPQILIGSAQHLATLSEASQRHQIDLSAVSHAVFVITDCRDVPIDDESRTDLWNTFGVPVYELLLGGDNMPIASECDVHEGWHVEDGVTFFPINRQLWFRLRRGRPHGTGLIGSIEDQPCACGRPGKRILNAEVDFRDPVRACMAASA